MSQILEIKSKSIEDAITNALEQLSVSREDIEVEVIENPVKGFLGLIGNKDGKYRITVLEKEEPKVDTNIVCCKYCGTVSDKATKKCPGCGAGLRR
mgnify:CR=1 FL=1